MRRALRWVWSPIRKLRRIRRQDHVSQPRLMANLAIEKILAESETRRSEASQRQEIVNQLAQRTVQSVMSLDRQRQMLHRADHPALNDLLLDVERHAVRQIERALTKSAKDMSDVYEMNPETGRFDGGQP